METDLRDRFDDRVLDASDKTYATSRQMEIMNEIIPICSLTEDVQDQVLDEYERVKNEFARKIGHTGKDNREDVTLLALVSLVMVPRIKTMISMLTSVGNTFDCVPFQARTTFLKMSW